MNHIKNTCEDNKAWCGKELDLSFYFKDTEAAVINGAHGELIPCHDCIDVVVQCLAKRRYGNELY